MDGWIIEVSLRPVIMVIITIFYYTLLLLLLLLRLIILFQIKASQDINCETRTFSFKLPSSPLKFQFVSVY